MCKKRIKQFLAFVFGERVSVGQGSSPHVLNLNHKHSSKMSDIVIELLLTSMSTATLTTSTKG